MDKHTWIGWYNNAIKYSWRIVGSHLFFIGIACVICYVTYTIIAALPEKDSTIANKATIVQCGAVILGLFSIVLTALQVRANATWNKVLSYHNHFGSLVTPEIIEKVRNVAEDLKFTKYLADGEQIPETLANDILSNPDGDRIIGCYLDEFEEFCGAVNAGVVDNEYAYNLEGTRIIRVWTIYDLFIAKCRKRKGSSQFVYRELEAVALRWIDRRASDTRKMEARKKKENGRGGMGTTV